MIDENAGLIIICASLHVAAMIVGMIIIGTDSLQRRFLSMGKALQKLPVPVIMGPVTEGIYSFVRNPIYTGGVIVLPGMAMALNSLHALMFSPVVFLLVAILTRVEEKGLRRAYGEQ